MILMRLRLPASFAMRDLTSWHSHFRSWLFEDALPLWSTQGVDPSFGGFQEVLNLDASPAMSARRARVQARQSFVFSQAGKIGWSGPWQEMAELGLSCLIARYRRPDGLFSTLVSADGAVLSAAAYVYDQAFVLLAGASLLEVSSSHGDWRRFALDLHLNLKTSRRHVAGGFREEGENGFLSNPHMHLLEAALAWIEVDNNATWSDLADEIAILALQKFIDPQKHFLREYFGADWQPLSGALGNCIEPGHQFEWAWLLERWSRSRQRADAHAAAVDLFAMGTRGVNAAHNVAIDEMDDAFQPRRATARLWPQTERLKAALILMGCAEEPQRSFYREQACEAAQSLWSYLEVPKAGLWRDKMQEDGQFVIEPAPASSLYHIVAAIDALGRV
jgi:mannose-1-phosphate guanylyltransferase/mannose-6-phosphate isomerase